MVIKAVACAYCLLRRSKNKTALRTSNNNCPSMDGTKYKMAYPRIIPPSVPIILKRKRRLVALKLGWLTNSAVSRTQ